MIDVGIGVAFIILAVAMLKYVEKRNKGIVPGQAEERLMARMAEIERRLTDIQDVMITIDEKLSRGTPGGRP
ncbi:MAG: hypothetical protein HOC74_05885 [Gemmatimonadetes bacterium]|jgi:hypothetical protein|nr:hypothetical protein [Gemmatimonadota bacterium]